MASNSTETLVHIKWFLPRELAFPASGLGDPASGSDAVGCETVQLSPMCQFNRNLPSNGTQRLSHRSRITFFLASCIFYVCIGFQLNCTSAIELPKDPI